ARDTGRLRSRMVLGAEGRQNGAPISASARRTEHVRLGRGRAAVGLAVGTASIVILGLSLGAATVRSHSGADAVPAPAASLSPAPSLHVVDEQGGQVAWDHRLHVKVEHGTLADVIVNDDTGVELTGVRSSDGQEWTSTESLVPRSTYTVAAG